jgi:NAD(P)-dependent dehydrogenase (short-subunit alcohol dehydrogenase family)
MTDLAGKRVVITGGTNGIGLATAEALIAGGARVLVTGRTPSSLDAARTTLGPAAIVMASDAGTGIDDLVDRAAAEFGAVDLLVLNAGGTLLTPLEDTTTAQFQDLFDLNTKAPFFTVQKFLPLLPPGSAVVFTTSISNSNGVASTSVYSATKAALRSMTRTFAAELIDRGIRVNAVSPGPVDTGILQRSVPEEVARQFLAEVTVANPMHRTGEPDEVAKAIIFLGFDATYTTGAELPVDGGASQL